MKKLLFLLITISIFGCSPSGEETQTNNEVSLSGTITNPKSDQITLTVNGKKEVAKIDENGKFQLFVSIENPGKFRFFHGGEYAYIYLSPDDQLDLTLDTDQFDESLKFSGTEADANNYAVQKLLKAENIDFKEIYQLEEEAFITKSSEIYKSKKADLEELSKKEGVSKKYLKEEAATLKYEWARMRLYYPDNYKRYTEKEITLSVDYHNYIKEIDFNDESLLEVKGYTGFLNNYTSKLANTSLSEDEDPYGKSGLYKSLKNKLQFADETFTNEKVKNKMFYLLTKDALSYGGNLIGNNIETFRNKCTDKELVGKLNEVYKKWEAIAVGMPAPKFKYKDTEGNEVSLDDFKGQYVYIDIWASWCGPCIRELPHLEKITEEYKDSNIAFVSISIDNTEKPWRKMLKKKEMKGIQLFATNAWESTLAKSYVVNFIPRFILIDKEGNIIDAQAERPSGKLKEILEGLDLSQKNS